MAGTLIADTVQGSVSGTPPQFNDGNGTQVGTLCRAWVNFDGSLTSPITPRSSFNVSSVVRNATGDYTINFSSAMPDANYSVLTGLVKIAAGGTRMLGVDQANCTTSAARVYTWNGANAENLTTNCVSIFR